VVAIEMDPGLPYNWTDRQCGG